MNFSQSETEANNVTEYRKISVISPGIIFIQKAFLLGLFLGELIFGGAYYWKEFCVSKMKMGCPYQQKPLLETLGKQPKTANSNSP